MKPVLVPLPNDFKSPHQVLSELGIQSPSQICLEAIAQYCGATVLYDTLQGSDARLVGFNSKAIITVNKESSPGRQRFSIAHELGHWMWDRGQVAYHCHDKEFDGTEECDSTERRANRYAIDLLMPESMVYPLLECHPLNFETVHRLARLFQTSFVATAIRLVELTCEPAVLIYEEEGRRKWYVRSGKVSKELKLKHTLDSPLESWVRTWPKEFAYLPSDIEREEYAMGTKAKLYLMKWKEK